MLLSHLFVYPIKSARGIAVPETELDISGPVRDRRWMLVDEEGLFLSQRKLPRMALIEPRFEGADLVVTAPGMPVLRIAEGSGEGELIRIQLWHDSLYLPHPNQGYSNWFSDFLGQSCRLVYLPDTVTRPVEPPFDNSRWRVSLADGYPLLVLTQASLDLLNQKLTLPVGFERFRPNLVISGTAPHDEDEWKGIRIGPVELAIVKPCARCSTVLVDQSTGELGIEPLRTLAQYRRRSEKVMFAQNALIVSPGELRVGTSVELLETAVLQT